MDKMDLEHQTNNKVLDITIFLVTSAIMSAVWREMLLLSLHTIGTGISVLFLAVLGYMAKNFWCPYFFPKEGNWRIFNFMNPNRIK